MSTSMAVDSLIALHRMIPLRTSYLSSAGFISKVEWNLSLAKNSSPFFQHAAPNPKIELKYPSGVRTNHIHEMQAAFCAHRMHFQLIGHDSRSH